MPLPHFGRGGTLAAIRRYALAQEPRRVATVLAVGIGLMLVLGAGQKMGLPLGLFDLDGEGKPPALWSALVLAAAGVLGVLVADADDGARLRWQIVGGVLMFMALDEAAALHEHIETNLHFDWQLGYAPIILVGGIAGLLCLQRMRECATCCYLWVGGAVLWAVSQIDENFQSNSHGRVHGYGALSTAEEILEVTGSALFLMALLLFLRRLNSARDA